MFNLLHNFVTKGIPLIHKGSFCTICGSLNREAPSYKLISDSVLAFQGNYLHDIASWPLTIIYSSFWFLFQQRPSYRRGESNLKRYADLKLRFQKCGFSYSVSSMILYHSFLGPHYWIDGAKWAVITIAEPIQSSESIFVLLNSLREMLRWTS